MTRVLDDIDGHAPGKKKKKKKREERNGRGILTVGGAPAPLLLPPPHLVRHALLALYAQALLSWLASTLFGVVFGDGGEREREKGQHGVSGRVTVVDTL